MWTRREALAMGGASWLLAGLSGSPLSGCGAPTPRAVSASGVVGPRYVVVVFLRGGLDAVYTTDPKDRADVAANVDIPYAPHDVVEAGALRLGPHFAGLKPYAGSMAVVRGLQVRTANHESGALQMLRLRTAVSREMPGILDIIGSRRDGQPLASVTLGRTSSYEHSPAGFGAPTGESDQTLFDALDDVSADDFEVLERVFADHVRRVSQWPASGQRDQTEEHLKQVTALFGRLHELSPFRAESWDKSLDAPLSRDLQRTLWLLENDLTRGVYLKVYMDWDSHYDNARKQTSSTHDFVPAFAQFLAELRERSNAYGALADNTLIVAGSELGRFPILNGNLGKDHFPETNVFLSGPGIASGEGKGALYGHTGPLMEGQPVSLTTGRPVDAGGTTLALDDLGTTLLHMTGYNPELYGYRGNRLRFLEQA